MTWHTLRHYKTAVRDVTSVQQPFIAKISKWKLHRFYAKNPKFLVHLPPTAILTPLSLVNFLNRYRTVYIKASTLHMGRGVIKAWRGIRGYDYVIGRGKVQHATSAKHLISKATDLAPNELFIVQRAVDLAIIKGRPYDIRVMMMRDGTRTWQFAGMLAKVHGHGSIVSNVQRGGGYVLPVQRALSESNFANKQIRLITKNLISLSRQIIRYSEKFPFYSFQSGIDLAVDKTGKIWIIEMNLHKPSHLLFKQLKDKSYYNQVRKLYRDYRKYNTRLI